MHHKCDVGSKDAFYIIDLATESFFWKFWIMSKEAHFVPSLFLLIGLTFPSHQPQFTFSLCFFIIIWFQLIISFLCFFLCFAKHICHLLQYYMVCVDCCVSKGHETLRQKPSVFSGTYGGKIDLLVGYFSIEVFLKIKYW